jgi:hypothetical protein
MWDIMIMLGFVYVCVMFDSSGKERFGAIRKRSFVSLLMLWQLALSRSVGRYAWMEKLRCGMSIWGLSLDLSGRALDELLDTLDGYA